MTSAATAPGCVAKTFSVTETVPVGAVPVAATKAAMVEPAELLPTSMVPAAAALTPVCRDSNVRATLNSDVRSRRSSSRVRQGHVSRAGSRDACCTADFRYIQLGQTGEAGEVIRSRGD
jgi:hypothetical protein